mmetsp:Transcript_23208/g.38901  ORF Transcript_23208/g.38901 Transcript_23208/m.38901 type:complete len:205 (-) Transcript_23208:1133-1747(-)
MLCYICMLLSRSLRSFWFQQYRQMSKDCQEVVYLLASSRNIGLARWFGLTFNILSVDCFMIMMGACLVCFNWLPTVVMGSKVNSVLFPSKSLDEVFALVNLPSAVFIVFLYSFCLYYEKKNVIWKRKNYRGAMIISLLKTTYFITAPFLMLIFITIPGLIAHTLFAFGAPLPPAERPSSSEVENSPQQRNGKTTSKTSTTQVVL